jgi:hypothetical protein
MILHFSEVQSILKKLIQLLAAGCCYSKLIKENLHFADAPFNSNLVGLSSSFLGISLSIQ